MRYRNLKIKFLGKQNCFKNKIILFISIFANVLPISQQYLISSGILLSTGSLSVLFTQSAEALDNNTKKFAIGCSNNFQTKNYVEAIKDCTKFIKKDPDSLAITRIYEIRAMSKTKISDYYGALSDLSEVIKREPNNPELYIMRALIKINNVNQIKSGCKDLKKAVSLGYPANKGVNKYCN